MYQNNQQVDPSLIERLKKRRNIYTIISAALFVLFLVTGLISQTVSWIFFGLTGVAAGCGLLSINYYRFYNSGGRKKSVGLWGTLLFFYGGIVVPWLTCFLANKITPLAQLILGVELEG